MDTKVVLRPYQAQAVENCRNAFRRGCKAVLFQLTTGGGKTLVCAAATEAAGAKDRRVLFLVHRRELIRQTVAKMADAGISCGVIAAGWKRSPRLAVQIAMVQTLARRADGIPLADLIVIDEAHHVRASTYRRLIAAYPRAWILGVTATPARLDGKGLGRNAGGIFDALVTGPTTADLIADDFLSPYRCFVPASRLDLSRVRMLGGDYVPEDLERAVGAANIVGDAVRDYRLRADHRPAIAFCISVQHAEEVAAQFRAAGYRAACVHGGLKTKQRDAILTGLATGEIEVVTSCDLISEGLDVPAVACVILMRPTKSIVIHLQQIGRGLRPGPGKVLVVNDHVGNCLVHGRPSDPRAWSLHGAPPPPARIGKAWRCEACGELHDADDVTCACGVARPVRAGQATRRTFVTADGDLAEMDDDARLDLLKRLPYHTFLAKPRSVRELRAYADHRGYKLGWVIHRLREQRQPPPSTG